MNPLAQDAEAAKSVLKTMWMIRRFEEAVEDLYGRGMMHGTMHLSIGQEAVPTGACLALNKDDYITSTHRGHGHCIAKGADIERMMAELLAKESGYCRGRGGSMHIADTTTGNLGANGIVAGGVPIATGAALSAHMRGTKQVAVCFHGDGAMGEGAWHEGVVLAAMWQLPVVFLCENNHYGMSMASEKAFNLEKLSDRAKGYGIPGVTVDGNDVQAVRDAVQEAVDRARSGGGPTFIEALTYRWRGHSKSDKNLYRTREEIEEWRTHDPIPAFEARVLQAGTLTETDLEEIRNQVRDELRSAVQRANAAPDATADGLLEAVYAS
ncbi:pyruvate dehydrogenase E1 component alpha subunit [Cryobacterium mesophilum]|uniref:Thiamine pyrophosphate-dependent dehydrogenase E1 component subunit alpha n=1 Tax=Terrimesophilobacter mesophilus TaxID=433647 RepID=A0A4R8VB45_9MICO|nr:thiamine pyrophosphate-dependent dehydrogenase E1 component subunit alpha [Terrimesophilobacter mesophilus]MBB5632771.1 pyruvate dehydrogenase E1 component alpha subunit [Terrimesophilobacter mesophilus]TFB79566.1 thiamine pyrophosphate-dependent dehydrogenase E1 component subunit alpha [Terrimesophilobacter mesophilus]